MLYFNQRNYELADKYYEACLATDSNDHVILNNLGLVNMQLKKYELAESYLKRAIAIKSDYI